MHLHGAFHRKYLWRWTLNALTFDWRINLKSYFENSIFCLHFTIPISTRFFSQKVLHLVRNQCLIMDFCFLFALLCFHMKATRALVVWKVWRIFNKFRLVTLNIAFSSFQRVLRAAMQKWWQVWGRPPQWCQVHLYTWFCRTTLWT